MAKEDQKPTAPPAAPEMVSVSADLLRQLQSRLEALERQEAVRLEIARNPNALILDPAYEAWKIEASRPAAERTQDIADRMYGTTSPRFRCKLDSTKDDGKPGPKIGEHPELLISANSDLEAQGRYLKLCGIKKHDYKLLTLAA